MLTLGRLEKLRDPSIHALAAVSPCRVEEFDVFPILNGADFFGFLLSCLRLAHLSKIQLEIELELDGRMRATDLTVGRDARGN